MTAPAAPQVDWNGPRPLNLIGRQWKGVMRRTGWRRVVAVAGIGVEVVIVFAVVLLLIL